MLALTLAPSVRALQPPEPSPALLPVLKQALQALTPSPVLREVVLRTALWVSELPLAVWVQAYWAPDLSLAPRLLVRLLIQVVALGALAVSLAPWALALSLAL